MKLTEKTKDDFEKWYIEKYHPTTKNESTLKLYLIVFWDLCDSKKYGVLEDFFDSVGLPININCYDGNNMQHWQYDISTHLDVFESETRSEARVKAIEKANEIYNQNN